MRTAIQSPPMSNASGAASTGLGAGSRVSYCGLLGAAFSYGVPRQGPTLASFCSQTESVGAQALLATKVNVC